MGLTISYKTGLSADEVLEYSDRDRDRLSTYYSRAADLLDHHGWVRHTDSNRLGQLDLEGAIHRAWPMSSIPDIWPVIVEMQALKPKGYPKHRMTLDDFNDDVANDRRQVTRLLRRTARKLHNRHLYVGAV